MSLDILWDSMFYCLKTMQKLKLYCLKTFMDYIRECDACLIKGKTPVEKDLLAVIPYIGLYIATASAICILAMLTDAVRGFRSKILWFPCKYFTLNSTSSTLLAVATKLTVDITSKKEVINEQIATTTSLVMMSTAIGNFMISMETSDILLNLTALGILVVTMVVNLCINYSQTRPHYIVEDLDETIAGIVSLLFMLIIFCLYATVVPTTKRDIESKYSEMHKRVLNERGAIREVTINELSLILKKYCVMTETGSPQFVMARSVICVISGFTCLFVLLILIDVHIMWNVKGYYIYFDHSSNYQWSTDIILLVQSFGVALCTISPVMRWFMAARFRSLRIGHRSFKEDLKVEAYWTQGLVTWRESPLPFQFGHPKFRKVVHDTKRMLLNVCILIQILLIFSGKLLLIFSASLMYVTILLFNCIKKPMVYVCCPSNVTRPLSSTGDEEPDFSSYVLLLEGEPELPKKIIANICKEVDKLISSGKRKQPQKIVELLQNSENFNGVKEFDNTEVISLHPQDPEPHNCWSLSVATLTSIAVALPNISDENIDELLTAVSEGLSFVKDIEKTMDTNGEFSSLREAADVIWVGLELYQQWQDDDIREKEGSDKTYMQKFQELSLKAEQIIEDFKLTNLHMSEVIAANSMYRICQTLLLAHNEFNHQNPDEMFKRLSVVISDILAACFMSLPQIITIKCQSNVIKGRVESVRQAAVLLGKSEKVLQLLQQRQLPPNVDPGKAAYIDEWRAVMDTNASTEV